MSNNPLGCPCPTDCSSREHADHSTYLFYNYDIFWFKTHEFSRAQLDIFFPSTGKGLLERPFHTYVGTWPCWTFPLSILSRLSKKITNVGNLYTHCESASGLLILLLWVMRQWTQTGPQTRVWMPSALALFSEKKWSLYLWVLLSCSSSVLSTPKT